MRNICLLFAAMASAALVWTGVYAQPMKRGCPSENSVPGIVKKHDADVKGILDEILRKVDGSDIRTRLDEILILARSA